MNLHRMRSLALVACLFSTGFHATAKTRKKPSKQTTSMVKKTAPRKQEPELVLKTIHNSTEFDILLVDRLTKAKRSVILPAGKTTEVHFVANSKNKVIFGSMIDAMIQDAQYIFKKLDQDNNPEPDQEAYFNLFTCPGGINDGSGFISGSLGSLVLKYYVANKNGGCQMISGPIDKNSQALEFELELSINEENTASNIFRLIIDGETTSK